MPIAFGSRVSETRSFEWASVALPRISLAAKARAVMTHSSREGLDERLTRTVVRGIKREYVSCVLTLSIFAILLSNCGVRIKPNALGPDLAQPDYVTTSVGMQRIPNMLKLDGKLNIFAADRRYVPSLGLTVTVLYFRPRTALVTYAALFAQVKDIWSIASKKVRQGNLGLLIVRCVPMPPSRTSYSYIFVRDNLDNWSRVRDDDYIDRVVQSGI